MTGPNPIAEASVRETARLVGGNRSGLMVTTLLAAGTGACGVALLTTSAWLIARAAQHPSVVALGVAVVGVRFFAVSRALCRYGERVVGHDTALRALAGLRVRVFTALERTAPAGLPLFRRGDLVARTVQDVDAIQDLMVKVAPAFGAAGLVSLAAVALTGLLLPAAGLVLAITLVFAAAVIPWAIGALAARREARLEAARGELSTQMVDLLEGAPELVAFGAIDGQLARIAAADAEVIRLTEISARTAALGSALNSLLAGTAVWAVLVVGVPAVHAGRLSGVLLAVLALIPLAAFEVVAGLPGAAQSLEGVRRSAARIDEVLSAPATVSDPSSPVPIGAGPHRLRIRGLRARYGCADRWALDGIDLDLAPGRRIAVVGPSGAGKSTLAAVLLRFLPYQGSVTLDGVELDQISGADARTVIGLAAQDTHIFDTTLRENLMLARRSAGEADLRSALAATELAGWADELPDGLDTELGADGRQLSGGERQRLGLARVALAGFPVIILDEPDEHLDRPTADALMAELAQLTRDRTALTISHRLASLADADEIVVLESGRVAERGTHEELVAAGGSYARQWFRECGFDTARGNRT